MAHKFDRLADALRDAAKTETSKEDVIEAARAALNYDFTPTAAESAYDHLGLSPSGGSTNVVSVNPLGLDTTTVTSTEDTTEPESAEEAADVFSQHWNDLTRVDTGSPAVNDALEGTPLDPDPETRPEVDTSGGSNSVYDWLAGRADHIAGSTDESFARQFDDEPGGGFLDWNTWTGIADHAAGSTDEWVGQRTSDVNVEVPEIHVPDVSGIGDTVRRAGIALAAALVLAVLFVAALLWRAVSPERDVHASAVG